MKVKCILCDKIDVVDASTLVGKQLKKKRILTYMCDDCRERIEKRTQERIATGNFRIYKEKKKDSLI